MMPDRSSRMDVRNPILGLAAFQAIRSLPEPTREALRSLLLDLSADSRARADKCWKTHKAPMALYWKCVAVYTGHIARALRVPLASADVDRMAA